jgi:hypothetical protein
MTISMLDHACVVQNEPIGALAKLLAFNDCLIKRMKANFR